MATNCNKPPSLRGGPRRRQKPANRIFYRKTFCFFTNISPAITFGLIQLPQNVTLTENYGAYWRQATTSGERRYPATPRTGNNAIRQPPVDQVDLREK
jgi:hypothetical protein